MTWVKLDDAFFDNPKNRIMGPAARDLFIAALCYCTKGLTDGRIPKADLPLVLAHAQAKAPLIKALVDAGRLEDCGDHYEVVNFLTYQLSRDEVLRDRAKAAERQRKWRESRRDGRAKSQEKSPPAVTGSPPRPDLTRPDPSGSGVRVRGDIPGSTPSRRPPSASPQAADGYDRQQQAANQLAERTARRMNGQACPICFDSGWVDTDAGMVRCEHEVTT